VNLLAVVTEPKLQNESERQYVLPYLQRHEGAVARAYLIFASSGWIWPIALLWADAISPAAGRMLLGFYLTKATVCLWLLRSNISIRTLRYAVFGLLLVAQVVWMAVALKSAADGNTSTWISACWIVFMLAGNVLLPFRSHAHNFMFVVSLISTYFGLRGFPEHGVPLAMTFLCLVIGQNYRIYTQRMIKAGTIRNYREQSRHIPRQVLMTAAREDKSIHDIFAPADRFCICICSDWRKFQSLSKGISMAVLGQGLALYYHELIALVQTRLPEGNFFLDWIADELFLVIFAKDRNEDRNLVAVSLEVSKDIMNYRKDFFARHGFPQGIDVTVACGVASVGIFGKGGIAKATAFGAAPGVARMLQGVAKKMRLSHGSVDRVVMTQSFVGMLDEEKKASLTGVGIEHGLSARDEAKVYVWCHGNSESNKLSPNIENHK
jgi:hypothetical protein